MEDRAAVRTPERAQVLDLVGFNKRVLEIGAHDGHFSQLLLEQGCQVTAVEIDPNAAEMARSVVGDVHCGNFEDPVFRDSLPTQFDVILFMHVVEHFVDPWSTLRDSRRLLKPGGFIIVLLPNVAAWLVRKDLFFHGRFEYQNQGILDRTHLRFFTLQSAFELMRRADYEVIDWQPADVYVPLESRISRVVSKSLAVAWRNWMLRRFPNLSSQVFLFRIRVK
jgi:2-polyprenyl-3-methyl-5-hydroxy-6-metoxy-1,4-benzoquinol methylase